MWFKNLMVYRLTGPFLYGAEQLHEKLAGHQFAPGGTLDMETCGWEPPREDGLLVHAVNRQLLLKYVAEKKLLPSSVVNQFVKERAADFEEREGFKPGRKQLKELKETVTDELLPRAFAIRKPTFVWVDPVNGWLVVDTGTPAKADEIFKLLLKGLDTLPFASLRTVQSPLAAMTDWLAADEAPAGFSVDQDAELRATGEGKATVRYVRHTLEPTDVSRHIAAGKQCTRIALTWSDRVSFVLTETLAIKRISPLDVLKETGEGADNAAERFDSDFALMAAELAKLLGDLVTALGGEEARAQAA